MVSGRREAELRSVRSQAELGNEKKIPEPPLAFREIAQRKR
jgi:hypothetical protein